MLFPQQTDFALLYPAILLVFHKDRPPSVFRTPEEAAKALRINTEMTTSPRTSRSPASSPSTSLSAEPTEQKNTSQPGNAPPKEQRKREAFRMGT